MSTSVGARTVIGFEVRPARGCSLLAAAVVLMTMQACTSERLVYHSNLETFLATDGLTGEAVISRLGPAFARFDGGRVLAYRLRRKGNSFATARQSSGWKGFHASLIVVLDEDGRVARHSLVAIRE